MNTKFLCCKGRIATKCCIYNHCKKNPFMCGSQTCDCEQSHLACLCDCRLAVVVSGLFKLNSSQNSYDRIVKVITDQKQELMKKVGSIKSKPLGQNQNQLLEIIKINKLEQITAALLSGTVDQMRNNVDTSINDNVNKMKGAKQLMASTDKKIKAQLKRIRGLWDENIFQQNKLRQKLHECGILQLRISDKKCKMKNFQTQDITEIHLSTINAEVIQMLSIHCKKLGIIQIKNQLSQQLLSSFMQFASQFAKLGKLYFSNYVSDQWKQDIQKLRPNLQILKYQQVARIQSVQPQPLIQKDSIIQFEGEILQKTKIQFNQIMF